jgi:hypothetical protein
MYLGNSQLSGNYITHFKIIISQKRNQDFRKKKNKKQRRNQTAN